MSTVRIARADDTDLLKLITHELRAIYQVQDYSLMTLHVNI